jgi:8-oxo-dGTP pyrophosphatase MutT (NUDIX family)
MAERHRPRDAATLILVRRDEGVPRILMGQRHGSHAFMPHKYVFPGGRVDATDSRVRPSRDLDAAVMAKLKARTHSRFSAARARAFAIAALRETYEETGLLFGRRDFTGAPDLSALVYFARAITPPGRTRRFDSRFFVADAGQLENPDAPHQANSGELLRPAWFTVEETFGLDLPSITKDILGRLRPFLDKGRLPSPDCPVSFQYSRRTKWIEEII